MTDNQEDQELRQRQQALEQREQEIRLRELELEISRQSQETEPPLYETRKEHPVEKPKKLWFKKVILVSKFFALMVVVFVALRVAYWLALGIMIASITWASYKLFLEGDHSKNEK